jgi:hypothetical protein
MLGRIGEVRLIFVVRARNGTGAPLLSRLSTGLLVVAFFPFFSAILVLILGHNPALERGVVPEAAD